MKNGKIAELINSQITKELESAYLYFGFANYFTEKNLNGFAHWYMIQAAEEIDHAKRFAEYLHDSGVKIELFDIQVVDEDFSDDLEVLTKGLQHERYITALIDNMFKESMELGDYRTMKFLGWFIDEQAEEERNAQQLIDDYSSFICDCGCGLWELDRKLGGRTA